tara:strand:+ start:141 stop:362 length:222 start_codon:yes stop_codon:yes gene_type:complete
MHACPTRNVQIGPEKRDCIVANTSARKQTKRLGTQRGPEQIQQGHATRFDFDVQFLNVFTFANQLPCCDAQDY